jgi:ABC-type transporter Mla subunit MlaD
MMNNEEFERRMTFIVDQQAQFAADVQQMRELQAQTENVVGRLAHATLEGFKDVNAKIDSLVDSQIRLTAAQAHTDESLARTDENLRNLIKVVDRYFSEGRNGNRLCNPRPQSNKRLQRTVERGSY